MSATDATAIRETLALAYHTLEPEERTQRQLFWTLMPELYVLRKKGFSFKQMTRLLNDAGFDLQPGTVRSYYNEMLEERMEECERRFDEQMIMLQEVQQITRSVDAPKLASKIAAARQQNQALVEQRVSKTLALPGAAPEPAVPPARAATTKTAPAAPQKAPPAEPSMPPPVPSGGEEYGDTGSFGLLGSTTDKVEVPPGAGFFNMNEETPPQVPRMDHVEASPAAVGAEQSFPEVPAAQPDGLRCAPLQAGVTPVAQRPGVPAAVYEEGLLEHPAIPGLMLTRDQRLYGALLEIWDADGEIFMETMEQKRFRLKWAKPVAAAGSEAGFVPLHKDALPGA